MIKRIVKCKDPEVLVITPLSPGSKVSRDTKKSIKRNRTPFEWVSYMGDGNPYKNTQIAYKQYRRDHGGVPKYVLKVDNDITASRYWIDKMYNTLESSEPNVSYAYTSFEFTGCVSIKFPTMQFNPQRLIQSNYISSCSLVKTQLLDQTGGFVIDDKYFRLLDWCLWLQFLKYGFIGTPVENAHFVAYAGPKSVSCRGQEDYSEKYQYVKRDFIDPLIT
jgi:hypothetical protein